MANRVFNTLISASTLRSLMGAKVPLTVVDASYNIPGVSGDPLMSHFDQRVPGAKFFEVDEIADKSSVMAHMMPSDTVFIDFMKRLQIKNDQNLLVVYDRLGMISSPRVWFTFKVFGKANVAVLDGGLPRWLSEGHPIETGKYELYKDPAGERNEDYNFRLDKSKVKGIEEIKKISKNIVESGGKAPYQILDARSEGRFNGTSPEPRKGLRAGSIPGSINNWFQNNYSESKIMKEPRELRKLFEKIGVNFDENVENVNLCGSGMTACINILALNVAGKNNTTLYDGSWVEWGSEVKV